MVMAKDLLIWKDNRPNFDQCCDSAPISGRSLNAITGQAQYASNTPKQAQVVRLSAPVILRVRLGIYKFPK
jgi:hypothetical protein